MNKKYHFLSDHTWLKEELLHKSMAQLAKELSEIHNVDKTILAGSIRFVVYRYFTKQERALMKKDRAFHKNRKRRDG